MNTDTWQVQEAKNKLSEVIDRASKDRPQLITRRGKPAVYVISAEIWERRNRVSLKKVIRSCPLPEVFDHILRDQDPGREIDL
jgi:antitoxin Phd